MMHIWDFRELDDIVFRNREKGYGAYYLRKIYRKNLAYSFFFALLIFLVFSLGALYHSYYRGLHELYYMQRSAAYESHLNEWENLLNEYLPSPPEKAEQQEQSPKNIEVVDEVKVEKPSDTDTNPLPDSSAFEPDSSGISGNEDGSSGIGFGDSPLGLSEVEQMPEFPGGIRALRRYLTTNAVYPPYAMKKKINGTVQVSFCIDYLGNVTDVGLVKTVHPVLDSTALSAIRKMPRWKPGYQHGRPVKVIITIPMVFVPVD
jgi:periplasmic protein TonB